MLKGSVKMKGKYLKRLAALLPILLLCAGCNAASDSDSVPESIVISSADSSISSGSSSDKSSSSGSSDTSSSISSSSSSPSSKPEESSSGDTASESGEYPGTYEESAPGYVESDPGYIESTPVSESSEASVSGSSSTSDEYSEPESSSSTSAPPAEPSVPDDPIQSLISQMSLKERIYQMFFVNPEQITGGGTVLTPIDLTDKPVGGILCMGDNLQSVPQTYEMLTGIQENAMRSGIGVFLAVDEEGGRVARCAWKLGTTEFDGMAVYGARNDADEAFNIGRTIGADIGALGFNVDFAPVADVDISPYNELGDRIFSGDPYVVANMVSNVVRGLKSSGVAATLKHFPGLGAENGNSHTESAIVIDRTLEQLRSEEFVPFKSGIRAGADFVMVGHQQVTAFGDELPADLSYTAVTEMLRGELGFEGIAVTDSQVMNTISNLYYPRTAAVMSVKAGIDMILTPGDLDDAVNGVYNAVLSGEISEERINESVTRILTVKQKMGLLA